MHRAYAKTCAHCGLRYYGITSQDPQRYRGSGVHWRNHLRKHGEPPVLTTVLLEHSDRTVLIRAARVLSDAFRVDDEGNGWANLKPETGDGGLSAELSRKRSAKPAWRQAQFEGARKRMANPVYAERLRNLHRKNAESQQWRERQRQAHLGRKWFNNGKQELQLAPDDPRTLTWAKGRVIALWRQRDESGRFC